MDGMYCDWDGKGIGARADGISKHLLLPLNVPEAGQARKPRCCAQLGRFHCTGALKQSRTGLGSRCISRDKGSFFLKCIKMSRERVAIPERQGRK